MSHDKNVTSFLDELPASVAGFDDFSRLEIFNFLRSLGYTFKALNAFTNLLLHGNYLNDRTGAEIIKECNVFPDSGGREVLYFYGIGTLVILMKEKLDFWELFDRETRDVEEVEEFFDDVLLNDKSFCFEHFPRSEHLEDVRRLNKKIEKEKEYYNNVRKERLDALIKALVDGFVNSGMSSKQFFSLLGSKHWDMDKQAKNKRDEDMRASFAPVINALFQSVVGKCDEADLPDVTK
ncbi:hypothetical protein C9J27_05695 [Photobacterium kishitanii]|uniref:Uncharacterized protein n=2 Tax=Photobacterium kishitanii TaxID=318456 RepID=A0A2T3KLV5_9GAMM|nr:hypothetical protein C9J27_05695 [Photobacterium kishitanii]